MTIGQLLKRIETIKKMVKGHEMKLFLAKEKLKVAERILEDRNR